MDAEDRWEDLLERATRTLWEASRIAEQEQSAEEIVDSMLWQAFCLGVNTVNDLTGMVSKDNKSEDADASSAATLRAKAAEVRAKIQMWKGLVARLGEIAEGDRVEDPKELKTEVDGLLNKGEFRTQELARRLIAIIDRKNPGFREKIQGDTERPNREARGVE